VKEKVRVDVAADEDEVDLVCDEEALERYAER
jgi:hypothetical protein